MMWGLCSGAYEKGKFGTTWGCHTSVYMNILYENIVAALRRELHGPLEGLAMLIGKLNACHFCENHRLACVSPTI